VKILLFGANGQLGHELLRGLAPLGEVVPSTRSGRLPGGAACLAVDLAEPGAAAALVRRQRPDAVVNASAYTAVDLAEEEQALATRVNVESVSAIAAACAEIDARLIHYSTDYVFHGQGNRPWREDDAPDPLGVYGRTKLAGERGVVASGCRHWIFRTAWVYAARGNNFLRTMLRLGAERDELRVVCDQVGSPTPARWLADATAIALARSGTGDGLWHLAAAGQTSWHGFATAIFEDAVRAGLLPRAPAVVPIASAEYPTRATRPAYSQLDCERAARDFGLRLPDWRMGLRQVIADIAS
jgi:dTDP-4-dehydrorhamnose reductase